MKNYASSPSGTLDRARKLRREATPAEKLLWRKLRELLPDAKFRRQSPVGPFIADFLSVRHRLIVEVDGGQHADNVSDQRRTRYLQAQGYRVLRVWNNEVTRNPEGVLHTIACALDPHPDPRPRGEGVKVPLPLGERGSGEAAEG